jgi:hypothetical protein
MVWPAGLIANAATRDPIIPSVETSCEAIDQKYVKYQLLPQPSKPTRGLELRTPIIASYRRKLVRAHG